MPPHQKTLKTAETARNAGKNLVDIVNLLRKNSFDIDVVSVGSTPAAFSTTTVDGITEM